MKTSVFFIALVGGVIGLTVGIIIVIPSAYAQQPTQFNETKYILEEASPEIRAAGQKLVNAIHEQLVFGFETGFSQDNVTLQQKITDAATEFYGLIAEQDPEVFKLMLQQQQQAYGSPEDDYDEDLYDNCIEMERSLGNEINQSDPEQDICHQKMIKLLNNKS